MSELIKAVFNEKYRFRESRDGLVSCVTCDDRTGGTNGPEGSAFCEHEERFRKIKIAEYWGRFLGQGKSHNIASKCICDAYVSKSLPEGVEKPILQEKHAILLGSQWNDLYHADINCPYIIEELRMQKEGSNNRACISIVDLSEMVPGETLRTICEMPCCESKLPFQIWIDNYRQRVGIKPDGTEPKIWVRNGIVKHEKKAIMTLEEAEAVFDLEKFKSSEFKRIHNEIVAASDHLHKYCNRLGSRPLSEAVNPVMFSSHHHILEDSLVSSDANADFWAYDERLLDIKKGLEKRIQDLEKIPEGSILCKDPKRIFRNARAHCKEHSRESGKFWVYGIVKNLNDENLISKGIGQFIEVGAISYHGWRHMWGVFGKDFSDLASFHEE